MEDTASVANELSGLVESAWASVLSLTLEAVPGPRAAGGERLRWTACVGLTGPSLAAVTIACSDKMAVRVAGAMFDIEPDATSPDEIRDALGELANIMAGQVKTLFGEPWQLGMPTVVEGSDFKITIRAAQPVAQMAFQCEGEPVELTVLRQVVG